MSELERCAYHESGHACACRIYGGEIYRVTIEDDAYLKRGPYRQQQNIAVEALSVICLSGPAAEKQRFGSISDAAQSTDIAMARRYVADRYADHEIELQLARMRAAAERLVVSERDKIETVAAALMRQGTLSGDAVIELLNGRDAFGKLGASCAGQHH